MIVQYDTQQCSFCQSRDTLEHRIFECPVTQTIRENNQALINDLMDTHKSFLHCPLFPVHDDWTLEQALCLSRGLDYEIEHTCDKVIAYTDGSTIPNNKATHLHSAYAVITIPTFIGEHKREVVEQYKADSTIPAFDVFSTFQGSWDTRPTIEQNPLLTGACRGILHQCWGQSLTRHTQSRWCKMSLLSPTLKLIIRGPTSI